MNLPDIFWFCLQHPKYTSQIGLRHTVGSRDTFELELDTLRNDKKHAPDGKRAFIIPSPTIVIRDTVFGKDIQGSKLIVDIDREVPLL